MLKNFKLFIFKIKNCKYFSIQFKKFTDISQKTQLTLFTRFQDNQKMYFLKNYLFLLLNLKFLMQ